MRGWLLLAGYAALILLGQWRALLCVPRLLTRLALRSWWLLGRLIRRGTLLLRALLLRTPLRAALWGPLGTGLLLRRTSALALRLLRWRLGAGPAGLRMRTGVARDHVGDADTAVVLHGPATPALLRLLLRPLLFRLLGAPAFGVHAG